MLGSLGESVTKKPGLSATMRGFHAMPSTVELYETWNWNQRFESRFYLDPPK